MDHNHFDHYDFNIFFKLALLNSKIIKSIYRSEIYSTSLNLSVGKTQ